MRCLILVFAAFILFSCKTYNDQNKLDFDKEIQQFVAKKNEKFKKSESGLYYSVISEGEGNPILPTDEVTFVYMGKLLNGTVFDSNHKTDPITFKVSKLILAWQESMAFVKKGGKIKIIAPPQLGYGESDIDRIPANSILYFELEILDVR